MPTAPFANRVQDAVRLLTRLAQSHAKEPKLSVGLDIGSSTVKVVGLGPPNPIGGRSLLGQAMAMIPNAAESNIPDAIKETLRTFRLPVKTVHIGVSGQFVIMRVVEMPKLAPQELAQALPFEAQRHLPFNIQDVVLDGVVLGPAEGNNVWVLIVACKREFVERRIGWLKQAGLEPASVDVDALAVANAFLSQANGQPRAGTHALMNVGAQWTHLVILKADVPYLIRDIPWGAEKLIQHLVEQRGLDATAVATQLKESSSVSNELAEALKGACELLTTELQLSFDFFENRFGPPPERVLVSGGLSQCASFLEALKAHVAQPAVPWTPTNELSGQLTVAYGLALRSYIA